MITSLVGARNPHVLCVHSGISGSVRLALKALTTINIEVPKRVNEGTRTPDLQGHNLAL